EFNSLVELIRRNFERYGFLPLETPSAERIEVLTSKGGAEKEIYALSRLAADADDEAAAKGALRFDLTVPHAGCVAMRALELAFPFRPYQIRPVWRGENPQVKPGRFREFYQCDIDIIGRETLSYLAEAEIPSVIYSVFREMAIGEFRIRINNRKVLKGVLRHFDVSDERSAEVLRALDKTDKEDERAVLAQLEAQGLAAKAARELYALIGTKRETRETLALLANIPLAAEGARHQHRGVPGACEDRQAVRICQQERLPRGDYRRRRRVQPRHRESEGPLGAGRIRCAARPGGGARQNVARSEG